MAIDDRGLWAFLKDNTLNEVRIDASALRKLDTGLVELLLSAAQGWRQKGLGFELTGLTPSLVQRFNLLGLPEGALMQGVPV